MNENSRGDEPTPGTESVCLVLVRHGRTALNAAGQLRGRLDPALDEVGVDQVEALAQALRVYRPRLVVTSPLRRALQTAEAIAEAAGVGMFIEGDLVDRDYGQWAGHTPEDLEEQFGSLDQVPGVETWAWLAHRAARVLDVARPSEPVALVTHEAVLQAMLEHLDPSLVRVPQAPACWDVITRDPDGRLRVSGINLQSTEPA
jgi:broad specificity phosphatase PhoE